MLWRPDPFPKMSQAETTLLPIALDFTCMGPDLRDGKISFSVLIKVCVFELHKYLKQFPILLRKIKMM